MKDKYDVIFIVPAYKPRMKEESLGTLILTKKAMLAGFKAKILRYWEMDHSPREDYELFAKDIIRKVTSLDPTLVSFYCRCEEYHICIDLAKRIKAQCPQIKVAFGGPQAELVAKETLLRFKIIDYVCCSEGENTIIPFLNFVKNGCKEEEICFIEGLTYQTSDGDVKQNKFPALLNDNFARDFYYYDLVPEEVMKNSNIVQIDVGRGCPFSCTFCSTKTFWKQKFRLRQITNTLDEIEYVVKNYGIRRFDFQHDLFTANKKRVFEFCDQIKKRGLDIEWDCDSRIDTIDNDMINRMIECGLVQIFFGIETGSSRMQALINKRLNLNKCDDMVEYCLSKGLKVTTSFIYGFPEELEEDIDATLKMIVKYQNYGCLVLTNMCHIMNGTAMYERFRKELYISPEISFNANIPAFDNLFDTISNNIEIFANFCTFNGPYRDELKYVDAYRYTLNYARQNRVKANSLLQKYDYGSLAMYRMFCAANGELLKDKTLQSNGDTSGIIRLLKNNTSSKTYCQMINNLLSALRSH